MEAKTRQSGSQKGFLLILVILLIFPAGLVGASEPYRPTIPLYIAVARDGEISVTSGKLKVPSHVVTLGAALETDTLEIFNKRLLVVRMEDQETLYDLKNYNVRKIQFDQGYYSATNLGYQGGTLVVEVERTLGLNRSTNYKLANQTQIPTELGRRSCFDSEFKSGMEAVVVWPVRMRYFPYIPKDVDENWKGSLLGDEKLIIRDKTCNAGVWLKVQRESGNVGWAKEWGLSEELVERTFIVPPPPDEE